jgi:hypothetical protein
MVSSKTSVEVMIRTPNWHTPLLTSGIQSGNDIVIHSLDTLTHTHIQNEQQGVL